MSVDTTLWSDRLKTEECLSQLEVVLQSEAFRKSPSVCVLLRYLVTKAVADNIDQIREVTIATEVFHRRDFDCRIDNIVRVQTHRLRKILEMYYGGEGKGDTLRFVLPKGSYVPQIHIESESLPLASVPETPGPVIPTAPPAKAEAISPESVVPAVRNSVYVVPRLLKVAALLAIAFSLGMAALWGLVVFAGIELRRPASALTTEDLLSGPLSRLWDGIIDPAVPTVVAYTNPVFLRGASGEVLFVYRGHISAPFRARVDVPLAEKSIANNLIEREKPLYFIDTWTGTGEVLAVRKLANQFATLRLPLNVKRSRLLSYEDMRSSNVIFIGSPWGNKVLDSLGGRDRPFTCCEDVTPSIIVNRTPRPGEPLQFALAQKPDTGEMTASYGIFTVMPGLQPGRKVVISSGLTTHASWAALDYFTSAAGVEELSRKMGVENGGHLPPFFDVVVRTEIINGEASKTSIVAFRQNSEVTK